MTQRDVVVEGPATGFRQSIRVGPHALGSDEPVPEGTDVGPNPYELLSAALGSCTSMTLGLYARRKGWPLAAVRVTVRHDRMHASDCADCETRSGQIDRFTRVIELDGPLDAQQRDRLREIADKCPVHRTLTSEIRIETTLAPAHAPDPAAFP